MASRDITYKKHHFNIHYDLLHRDNKETVMILHGWGSNKEIMKQAFSQRLKGYRHLYVDLPGFGKSANDTPLTTKDYASIMIAFLEALDIKPDMIMGHSFGGKVATLLQPPTLVLLSSAGIPTPKSLKVKIKIRLFKLLKPLGFGSMRRFFASSDVENMNDGMYQTFKNVVDEDFTNYFRELTSPAFLFWGREDSATPLSSGEKMAALIPQSHFYPLRGDHFFFLKEATFIEETLLKELHGNH